MPSSKHKLDSWKLAAYKVWAIIGICIIAVGCLYVMGIIWQAVAIVIAAALIVFLLHGIVNLLEAHKVPRVAGAAIALVGSIILILGCFLLFIPQMISQFADLANAAPGYFQSIKSFVYDYASTDGALITVSQIYSIIEQVQSWLTNSAADLASKAASGAFSIGVGVGNFLLILFISLLASFWVLIDLPKISEEFLGLFDEEDQGRLRMVGSAFGDAIYGWSKATLICAVAKGILVGVACFIAGIPYASIIGFTSAIFYIIPYIGPIISCVINAALGLTVSIPGCIAALIITVVFQELVAQVLSPRLMKSSVNVHPAIILVVLIVGSGLGGVLGMVAAIPIAAAVQSLFVSFYEARTGKTLYSEDGALFHKDKDAIKNIKKAADTTLTNMKRVKK